MLLQLTGAVPCRPRSWPKKADLYIVRTDGQSCSRETVRGEARMPHHAWRTSASQMSASCRAQGHDMAIIGVSACRAASGCPVLCAPQHAAAAARVEGPPTVVSAPVAHSPLHVTLGYVGCCMGPLLTHAPVGLLLRPILPVHRCCYDVKCGTLTILVVLLLPCPKHPVSYQWICCVVSALLHNSRRVRAACWC